MSFFGSSLENFEGFGSLTFMVVETFEQVIALVKISYEIKSQQRLTRVTETVKITSSALHGVQRSSSKINESVIQALVL